MLSVYQAHAPDFVVNFAAESHNDRAIDAPGEFMRANALGAQAMLECSRTRPVSRHLHVSTIEVYGGLPEHAEFFTEASPLNAKAPYSAAKAAGDQIVRAHADLEPAPPEAATNPALLPIFDISARREVTNLDFIDRVLAVLGRDPAEWIEHVADRPNRDRRYLINPIKIETQLGWEPTIEFESGLEEAVRWYIDNEAWWTAVFEGTGELQVNWA